jgi:CDP-glycerol glycerophosphotransferase (TagB/SpsB family)
MQLIGSRPAGLMGLLVIARMWLVRLAFYPAKALPLRSRVVLATAHFDHLEGNLKAIRDELARRDPAIPVATLAYSSRPGLRGAVKGVFNALVAGYQLATARVFIVDDYFFPLYVIRPRPGSTVIQVWHACGAFKKFGHSIGDRSFGADPELTRRVRIHSNYDVCLASSRATAECYAEAFEQPLERFVWSLGIPRTDVLVGEPKVSRTRERLRRQYGIPDDQRVVLYAPTFRGDRTYAAHHPTDLDLDLLQQVLGNDHVILLRLHPLVRSAFTTTAKLAGFVLDASGHADVNELMLASDVLVTDYSSVIFEFALLGRPIALFAPDHEAYERERGFYFDYRADGPGPIFETTRELADYLRAGDLDTGRVERFRQKWLSVADGHSTERFVDQLLLPALAGEKWKGAGPDEPAP